MLRCRTCTDTSQGTLFTRLAPRTALLQAVAVQLYHDAQATERRVSPLHGESLSGKAEFRNTTTRGKGMCDTHLARLAGDETRQSLLIVPHRRCQLILGESLSFACNPHFALVNTHGCQELEVESGVNEVAIEQMMVVSESTRSDSVARGNERHTGYPCVSAIQYFEGARAAATVWPRARLVTITPR